MTMYLKRGLKITEQMYLKRGLKITEQHVFRVAAGISRLVMFSYLWR